MAERGRTRKKEEMEGRGREGREENFKVIGHATLESEKSAVCRTGPQAGALGEGLHFQSEAVCGMVPALFGLVCFCCLG